MIARAYDEVRAEQEGLIDALLAGEAREGIIICQHLPVLTVGRGAPLEQVISNPAPFEKRGIELRQVSRGGAATLHTPGQLVIYPVVNLRRRGLAVRKFVSLGLEAMVEVLAGLGLDSFAELSPAGVYISSNQRKIASVGLRIDRGVSNHGFSLNVNCDLEPFELFVSCAEPDRQMTSVAAELGPALGGGSLGEIAERLRQAFSVRFLEGAK